ncbi:M48 family metalloprotease [Azospirillum halopraeferens]|uniref:M48 family metalloprotease n=1 Tax=Azospirillum halopraeferens TaxID=34010 RepID=UPI0003FEAE52|nr:M48 family metalloprotease [Azospirillum halopraeferens]
MSVRRAPIRCLAALALSLLAAACAVNPATGDRQFTGLVPVSQDAAIGRQEHPKVLAEFGGAYDNPRVRAFVDRLGRTLAAQTGRADVDWTFTVLDTDVVNAFALPGGYVYITRGLLALAGDEAEVAGVLAHEIGHVVARHTAERISRSTVAGVLAAGVGAVLGSPELARAVSLGSELVLAGYSREQELEADRLGVAYLAATGYDPFAMATFLETMGRKAQYDALVRGGATDRHDFLSTHPRTEERVERAAALARTYPPADRRRGDGDYLQAVAGMVYGDSPENGFVRGTVFAHPQLGFRFEVPQGYTLLNGAQQVVARGPGGSLIVFDGGTARGGSDMVAYIARDWAAGARFAAIEPLEINGLPAATGVTQGRIRGAMVDLRLVAIRMGPRIYRFTMVSPSGGLTGHDAAFRRTAASFRTLGRGEAAALQPHRLRTVTVRPGDTAESLAAGMADQPRAVDLFRILNNLPPGTPLTPGRTVKVVAG